MNDPAQRLASRESLIHECECYFHLPMPTCVVCIFLCCSCLGGRFLSVYVSRVSHTCMLAGACGLEAWGWMGWVLFEAPAYISPGNELPDVPWSSGMKFSGWALVRLLETRVNPGSPPARFFSSTCLSFTICKPGGGTRSLPPLPYVGSRISKFLYITGLIFLHFSRVQVSKESYSSIPLEEKAILAGKKKEQMMCAWGILYPDEVSFPLSISLLYLCTGDCGCQREPRANVWNSSTGWRVEEAGKDQWLRNRDKSLRTPGPGSVSSFPFPPLLRQGVLIWVRTGGSSKGRGWASPDPSCCSPN